MSNDLRCDGCGTRRVLRGPGSEGTQPVLLAVTMVVRSHGGVELREPHADLCDSCVAHMLHAYFGEELPEQFRLDVPPVARFRPAAEHRAR